MAYCIHFPLEDLLLSPKRFCTVGFDWGTSLTCSGEVDVAFARAETIQGVSGTPQDPSDLPCLDEQE